MKKLITLLLALAMLFALAACGGNKNDVPTVESTEVATGATPSGSNAEATDAEHIHKYVDNVIAATCTEDGYILHTCACGDSYTDSNISATGHSFGEWHTTKEPTTSETGSAERMCSNCDEKETKVLGKLIDNHQHNYTSVITTHPTCTVAGTTTFSCSCGDTYTEPISKLLHKYSDIITNPTCTNGGYTTHTCSVCGDSFRDSNTKATGHSWTDATCTVPKSCSLCGSTEGDSTGHNWNAATCTTPKTCSKCSSTEGSAKGHDWADATCTAPKTCFRCNATEGKAAGHSWDAASCTTPKTCSKCHITEGSLTPHSWLEATCTTPKTCKTCGVTEGSAAGHSWNNATCTTPKTCNTCGVTEGSAAGHSWNNATCTAPKTCKTCGATEGGSLDHTYAEESKTNGNNVGSVITYRCALCGQTRQKTIEQLSVSAYRSGSASFNNWLSQVSYTVTATGGYGKYQYKYEVYLTESSTSPALTEDFSENNRFGWTSRFYCNGNVLVITVKDEAGNSAKMKIVVDTEDKIVE